MKKQYIKAIDIIAEVMRKWYVLVICVVVMAIVVPNVKYLNDKRLAKNNIQLLEQEKDDEENNNIDNKKNNYPDEYYKLQNQIDEWKAYLKRSAFMKLDPYNMVAVRLTYEIDDCNVALPAYMAYVSRRTMAIELGEKLDNYSAEDIQDLVSCETLGTNENSKILLINIYALDENEANVLSSAIKVALNGYGEKKSLITPQLVDENIYKGLFTGVYDTQVALENRISTLISKRDSYIPNNSDTKSETTTSSVTDKIDEENLITEAHFNNLYIIIGAFLGVILDIIIIVILICVSDKIRNDEAIKDILGLDFFGRVKNKNKSKWKIFIDKLFYTNYANSNILISVLRIAKVCENKEIKTIYLTGHITNIMVIESLEKKLKEKGIEVLWTDSLCGEAENLAKVLDVGNILFIEELEKASFRDIVQDITVANEQNISILGYVTVGA